MPIRSDPLDELAIPDGTTVEEHDLVTDGDVLVGGQSTVEFGVRGNNVVAGERVTFGGHIEAEGDCRLDMWSEVTQDVLVGQDAYLGERVEIGGELKVAGNLDIGDDVDIDEGFEANGWITIRNPMPTIVFLVVYLSQLLRIGEEEAAEQFASELLTAEARDDKPVVVPRGAHVSDETWRVSTPASVGENCRLHGNVRAERLTVGADTVIFGSLRAKGDVEVGADTEVKGDVTTRNGDVRVDRGAHVWGDISAEDVVLHEHAVVEGTIRVSGELTQRRDPLGPEPDETSTPETDASDDGDERGLETETETDTDESETETETETVEVTPPAEREPGEAADAEAETGAADGQASGDERTAGEEATMVAKTVDGADESREPLDWVVPEVDAADNAENGHGDPDAVSVDE